MKIIRCIDVESTSIKDPPDAAVCEIGWQDVAMEEGPDGWAPSLLEDGRGAICVASALPIEPEARAVHHITDAEMAEAQPIETVLGFVTGADFYAAHSSEFEKKFLAAAFPGKPWICTLKAARRVWPEAPGHGLQVLRYWRGQAHSMLAHRAGPDAYIGALLLVDLIRSGATVREMVAWEQQPSLLPGLIRFGKHKGVAWKDAPADYLDWIVGKSDMDEDTKYTARHWLAAKAAA